MGGTNYGGELAGAILKPLGWINTEPIHRDRRAADNLTRNEGQNSMNLRGPRNQLRRNLLWEGAQWLAKGL